MTPSRKALGKSLARGSKCAVVRGCFEDAVISKYIIRKVANIVHHEIVSLCSDRVHSSLLNPSTESLENFSWEALYTELNSICPVLTQILKMGMRIKQPRHNHKSIISLCISMMCNYRHRSMSLPQQIISVLLYSGHCSKEVCTISLIESSHLAGCIHIINC